MKALASILAAASLLSACVSAVVPTEKVTFVTVPSRPELQIAAPGKGELVVKRDAGGGPWAESCIFILDLNGEQLVRMEQGQGVRVYLPAGSHLLRARFTELACSLGDVEEQVTITSAKATVMRVATDQQNRLRLMPTAY